MRNPTSPTPSFPRQRPPGKPERRSSYKAPVVSRIGAALIDLVMGSIPGVFFSLVVHWSVGVFILAIYMLVRDGMAIKPLSNQSIGKKLVRLHVEIVDTGKSKLDPMTSIRRNALLGGGLLLSIVVGLVTNPFIGSLVSTAPFLFELMRVLQDANGLRFGDQLAGTKVLD